MTEMRPTQTERRHITPSEPEPTGWVGWILFAGIMLLLIAAFQGIAGLVALFNDKYYVVTKSGLLLSWDYTAWGWVHIGFAVLAAFAGYGVMVGQMWARVFGIAVAFLSALANLAFLGAYPLWSAIMITVDVLIIYALAVHGREVKSSV